MQRLNKGIRGKVEVLSREIRKFVNKTEKELGIRDRQVAIQVSLLLFDVTGLVIATLYSDPFTHSRCCTSIVHSVVS